VTSSDSSRVRWKRSGELWSTIYRKIHVSLDPLKWNFWEGYISALRGCFQFKFLHELYRDWARLPSAYQNWDAGLPKNFNRENLKFGLKFSVWATITSGLVGVSSWNFFQSTCHRLGVITRVQLSKGPPPKICEGEKNVQNSAQFLTTFDFDFEYLRNRSSYRKSKKTIINYNPFHVGPKMVNSGSQTTKLKCLILTNRSGHFSGDYISAIRGCWPLKFLRALEIDQGYLAHSPTGTHPP